MSNPNTFLLIGGAGGIGTEVSTRLFNSGHRVVIAERDEDKAQSKAAELGAEAEVCDATDFDQVQDLVARVLEKHGRLDGVANLAGSIVIKPATSISADEFRETIDLNLTSAFALVRAASRPMQKAKRGRSC